MVAGSIAGPGLVSASPSFYQRVPWILLHPSSLGLPHIFIKTLIVTLSTSWEVSWLTFWCHRCANKTVPMAVFHSFINCSMQMTLQLPYLGEFLSGIALSTAACKDSHQMSLIGVRCFKIPINDQNGWQATTNMVKICIGCLTLS